MKRQFSVVNEMLLDAGEDLTAFRHFSTNHWQKIWSTNSLERLNAVVKRRTNVVGIFPNDAAALRLITAVVVEQHDEWSVSERRYMSQESMDQLKVDALPSAPVALAKVKREDGHASRSAPFDLHHSAGRDRSCAPATLRHYPSALVGSMAGALAPRRTDPLGGRVRAQG